MANESLEATKEKRRGTLDLIRVEKKQGEKKKVDTYELEGEELGDGNEEY